MVRNSSLRVLLPLLKAVEGQVGATECRLKSSLSADALIGRAYRFGDGIHHGDPRNEERLIDGWHPRHVRGEREEMKDPSFLVAVGETTSSTGRMADRHELVASGHHGKHRPREIWPLAAKRAFSERCPFADEPISPRIPHLMSL